MAEYIDKVSFLQQERENYCKGCDSRNGLVCRVCEMNNVLNDIEDYQTADVVEVVHGRWLLEAHDERVNYRWNVTAECSNCCDEKTEIWAGFFPNVPDSIARDVALVSAESVKLSNYCPNCGAKMDGERRENNAVD